MIEHIQYLRPFVQKVDNRSTEDFHGISHRFEFSGLQAYAGQFDGSIVGYLENHSDVDLIQSDFVSCPASLIKQERAGFALDLISHRSGRFTSQYLYDNSAGEGTYAYVIDSGIFIDHADLEGRASLGYNAVPDTTFQDSTGHGTHIAGIIGSKTYGVAKKCNLIAVKVLEGEKTNNAILLDGILWAIKDVVRKGRQATAVINVSVTGEHNPIIDRFVDKAFARGVSIVAAAGNSDVKASTMSPGSADGALTVAATNLMRERGRFSNYGRCVNMFAPGVGITSTSIGNRYATQMRTGTSQAAAYVAGLILYHKRLHALPDARTTMTHIMQLALRGVVRNSKASGNLFAYNGSGG
ncbi:alkaline protease [Myriangium duriaei CBS 260.36]|uniref:Alkaline protease n=1 Tax=Myriangium duriaei CBS 260.36 TaxID=1168546 RepID=A0A9P4MR95_9PEZI|nr:alkaline protease [Myriangium duriaei CBS 260.36]